MKKVLQFYIRYYNFIFSIIICLTITTKDNDITCEHYDFKLHVNEYYSFDTNKLQIKDFLDWYQRICNYERKLITKNDFVLETPVKVKQFDMKNFKKNIRVIMDIAN